MNSRERQSHAVNSKLRKRKTKVPKVCIREKSQNCGRFLGKLGSGWKSQNSRKFLGKLGSGVKVPKLWRTPRVRAKFRRHMLKHNWKTYRATLDQGGIEPPTDPDRPYCICLVGHWLGRRNKFPKKYHFFGKIKNYFPKIVVKFRPPSRGLRKHRLSLYSRRLSLYSPIFPKK